MKLAKADEPFFDAILTPHRSLGQAGFKVLMGLLVVFWLVLGGAFLSIGAWPIFGFLGLDIVAIWAAFYWNYRAARARELVSVSRTKLAIRKIAPSGKSEDHGFNPFWARLKVDRHEEIGVTAIAVTGEGRTVGVGAFLNPDDRESFAKEFGRALATARAG